MGKTPKFEGAPISEPEEEKKEGAKLYENPEGAGYMTEEEFKDKKERRELGEKD